MPRLNLVEPSNASGRAKEIFEGPLKGKHFNIFKGLANSPAALESYVQLSGALSKAGLSAKEREAIALAVGEANDCGYCVAAHTAIGKQAGLTEQQAIGARRGSVEGDPKLDALVKFVVKLNEKRGWVSDEDVKTFKSAGYEDGHVAEAVATYALNIFTNYFNHVADTPVDFPGVPALD